jgi:hypothetical protein
MSLQAYTPYTYSPGFKTGEFHHAVLSISGTTHTLYLDGSAVNIITDHPNIFDVYNTITNTVIGAKANGLTQAFKGFIGDVRVYNYAISASQVSSLYLNRNLMIHYPFDTSVNKMTPNYGTLLYDASMIGNLSLTTGFVGTNALSLTNSITTAATQYIKSAPSNWYLNSTTGLTISCWVNTAGASTGKIIRLFDIIPFVNSFSGLSVDISGKNMIYSKYIVDPYAYIKSLSPTEYFPLLSNYTNYGSSSITISASTPANVSFTTISSKTCVKFQSNAYLISSSLGGSLPLPISFCFWCYLPTPLVKLGTDSGWETFCIGDGQFTINSPVLQSDIYDTNNLNTTGFSTFIAVPNVYPNPSWTIGAANNIPTSNATGQWNHICYTISQNNIIFYLNGTSVNTYSTVGVYSWRVLTNYYYILGRAADNSVRYLNSGGIRHFASFRKVLTSTEVAKIYSNTV